MDEVIKPTLQETRIGSVVKIGPPQEYMRTTGELILEERARKDELTTLWLLLFESKFTKEMVKRYIPFRYITDAIIDKFGIENGSEDWSAEMRPGGLAARATIEKLEYKLQELDHEDKFVTQEERDKQIQQLKEKIADYARVLKEIYTASIVEVSSKTLGTVSAQMSEVKAHGDEIGTIYLLPGIAGGLTEMENVVAELTWQGYRVITIGYPESVGTLSEEYAAGGNGKPLGPQIEFMSAVILEKMTKTPVDLTKPQILMGFSTGGITAAGILGDEDMAHRFSHAVIMSPGGAQDRSLKAFVKGVVTELGQFNTNHTDEFQPSFRARNPDGSLVALDLKQLLMKANTLSRLIPQTMHQQDEIWEAVNADLVNTVVCASPDDVVTGAHHLLREMAPITQAAGKGSIKTAELTGSHIAINADPLAMLLAPFRRLGLQLRHPPLGQEQIAPNPFV